VDDEWPPLGQLGFWNIAEREPDRPALLLPDGSTWTFGALREEANRLSHGLRALGLRPGDGIAALLPNDVHAYTVRLAAFQTGLYLTALNHHLTGPEIAYVLGDAETRVLIADDRFAETARRAVQESGGMDAAHCLSVGEIEGFTSLAEIVRAQPDTDPPDRRAGQLMPYTSGTTGKPKGVRRPLPPGDPTEVAAQSAIFARAFGLRPFEGTHLVLGPLYHAGPYIFSWGSLDIGHRQIVTDRFDAEETLRAIETHRVTNTHLVATMFHRLLALPPDVRARYDVSSLRMVAHSAAPTPVELKKQMMDWWGPVIWETYGGTEGAATISKPHHWLAKPGTVGRPIRGVRIRILDEEGKPCPTGTPGRIYTDRDGPKVEYWKDPEKTREVHRGDAMTLGDIGYLDEDGFLFLTGRQSETIISGGVNIYPAEVEDALLGHPDVVDLAVIGVPDEEWGERVIAIVQARSEPATEAAKAALEKELLAFARDRVARFKCPREIHFQSELPREENGKLYRLRLREAYWQDSGRSI
jgi:long-chain acyl-CoA synthetase